MTKRTGGLWFLPEIKQHWQDLTRGDAPYPLPQFLRGKLLPEVLQILTARYPDNLTDEEFGEIRQWKEQAIGAYKRQPQTMEDYLKIRPTLRELGLDLFTREYGELTDEELTAKAATYVWTRRMDRELLTLTAQFESENLRLYVPLYYQLLGKLQTSPDSPWEPGPLTTPSTFQGYPAVVYTEASHLILRQAEIHQQNLYPADRFGTAELEQNWQFHLMHVNPDESRDDFLWWQRRMPMLSYGLTYTVGGKPFFDYSDAPAGFLSPQQLRTIWEYGEACRCKAASVALLTSQSSTPK
jgi:hypothetical protein